MPESSSLLNDLNKIFIPCRTVIEMEAITSLYLMNSNYDQIKELPESRPSSKRLINVLKVIDNQFYMDIIDFFINCAIPKVKPVVMYARNHHERYRSGNVVPNTKTRVCVFLALHRLKVKLLIIKNFIDKFKANNFNLESFYEDDKQEHISFLSALAKEYYKKNKMNLKLMFPKRKVSQRVKDLLVENDAITTEKLLEMVTSEEFSEKRNIIKFIMREIKASIFVCKLMFAKMDLHNPFHHTDETMTNAEDIMISNDFIPELLPAISESLRIKNFDLLNDCIKAFEFLMNRVLNSINRAIDTTFGGQIKIGLYEGIYTMGNIFAF